MLNLYAMCKFLKVCVLTGKVRARHVISLSICHNSHQYNDNFNLIRIHSFYMASTLFSGNRQHNSGIHARFFFINFNGHPLDYKT